MLLGYQVIQAMPERKRFFSIEAFPKMIHTQKLYIRDTYLSMQADDNDYDNDDCDDY